MTHENTITFQGTISSVPKHGIGGSCCIVELNEPIDGLNYVTINHRTPLAARDQLMKDCGGELVKGIQVEGQAVRNGATAQAFVALSVRKCGLA